MGSERRRGRTKDRRVRRWGRGSVACVPGGQERRERREDIRESTTASWAGVGERGGEGGCGDDGVEPDACTCGWFGAAEVWGIGCGGVGMLGGYVVWVVGRGFEVEEMA